MPVLLFFKRHWIKFIVCIVVGFAFIAIYNSGAGSWTSLYSYVNGAFIGGGVLVFVGMLSIVTGFGAFNLASFYFNRRRVEEGGRKENYTEYTVRKEEERSKYRLGFLPYMIVGTLYLAFGLIAYYGAIAR